MKMAQMTSKPTEQAVAARKEMAARVLTKRSLMAFTLRMNPKYLPGWVHEDICRRLEQFSKDVAAGLSPRLMLLMPPRHGKLLADSTRVPTPQGWVTHGELRAGDEVFHPSGRAVKVLGVSGKDKADIKVTLSNGEEVLCHENHEWTVFSRPSNKWITVETSFLADKVDTDRCRYQLPIAEALEYPNETYTTHPYVLGAWLGDGSRGKPCITGAASDNAITEKIQSLGYGVSAVCIHNTTGVLTTYFSRPRPNVRGRLTKELQDLGIYNQKIIPESYLRLTKALRLELLAGLIDTDGYVNKDGRVIFTSTSRPLINGVMELCEGLGFRPYEQEVQPTLSTSGIQGKQVYWTVGFQPTMAIPTALARKQVTRFAKQRRVGIKSIERITDGEEGHCIQVDSPDGLYLVGGKLTATHNSELASKMFPAWHLGNFPDHEFIACSYNISLAMGFSKKIKALLDDPAYQSVFDARLHPDNRSTEEWAIHGHTGGYVAAGVGGGITGKGAHILVIDDPIKNAEEADSATTREGLWDWYGSTAYTRLAPGAGVLVIQTWWHDDDLAGKLQQAMINDPESDQFEIIKYPAIAEHDEYLDYDTDLIVYDEPPANGKLLRVKGDPLHEARYDIAKLKRIKATIASRFWAALYQQNPVPDDGSYFTKDQFRRAPIPSRLHSNVFVAWDFAISEKQHNDYTVGTVGLQDHNDVLNVAEVVRFKSKDAFFIVEAILNLAKRWYHPSLTLGFEDGQIYRSIEALLKKRMRELKFYPSIVVLKPISDKQARARVIQGRMQQGMVEFNTEGEWYEVVRTEMLRFPAGVHDDCVDSLAWMAQMAVGKEPPRLPQEKKPKSWRDKLSGRAGASTHMAA